MMKVYSLALTLLCYLLLSWSNASSLNKKHQPVFHSKFLEIPLNSDRSHVELSNKDLGSSSKTFKASSFDSKENSAIESSSRSIISRGTKTETDLGGLSKRKKIAGAQILLQQSFADDTQALNDFFSEVTGSIESLQNDNRRSLENAQNQLKTTIEGDGLTAGTEIDEMLGLISDQTKDEEARNVLVIQQAYSALTKEFEEVEKAEQESEKELKGIKVMILKHELDDVKPKLEAVNEQMSQLLQKLLPMKSTCQDLNGCAECTADPRCGWCVYESKCIQGTAQGGTFETCSSYNFNICSGSGCAQYKDCNSCITDTLCGWCESPSGPNGVRCLEKPANYTGCPPRDWYHSNGAKNQCDALEVRKFEQKTERELQGIGESSNTNSPEFLQTQKEFIRLKQQSEFYRNEVTSIAEELRVLELQQFQDEDGVIGPNKAEEETIPSNA